MIAALASIILSTEIALAPQYPTRPDGTVIWCYMITESEEVIEFDCPRQQAPKIQLYTPATNSTSVEYTAKELEDAKKRFYRSYCRAEASDNIALESGDSLSIFTPEDWGVIEAADDLASAVYSRTNTDGLSRAEKTDLRQDIEDEAAIYLRSQTDSWTSGFDCDDLNSILRGQ